MKNLIPKKPSIGYIMPHREKSDGISREPSEGISPEEYLSKRAWEKKKKEYLKKPEGAAEWEREKHEFYVSSYPDYDVKLIPTDDGEVQDEGFKSKLKKWQLAPLDRRSPIKHLKDAKGKPHRTQTHITPEHIAKHKANFWGDEGHGQRRAYKYTKKELRNK